MSEQEARPDSAATWWQPVAAAVGFTVLWVLLAARSPTTTYHLAPLLVAAAMPVARRWITGAPVRPRSAAALAAAGLALALATVAGLAWQGMLAGPDVTGGDGAAAETVLLAVSGAVLGWWVARRQGRGEPS